jgi:hypothetical protein
LQQRIASFETRPAGAPQSLAQKWFG